MLKFEKYYGIIIRFVVNLPSQVRLFETPWTVALQVPLSMGFPRQEYWSGLPFPTLGHLLDSGIEPTCPALAGGFFTTEPPGNRNKCSVLESSQTIPTPGPWNYCLP